MFEGCKSHYKDDNGKARREHEKQFHYTDDVIGRPSSGIPGVDNSFSITMAANAEGQYVCRGCGFKFSSREKRKLLAHFKALNVSAI